MDFVISPPLYFKLVALVAVFGAACANDSYAPKPRYAPRPSYGGGYGDDYKADANYKFAWEAVATGAGGGYGGYGGYDAGAYGKGGGYGQSQRFGQEENRYGDQTQGKYWVELPDGRLQTVDYSVDGYSGFVAQVSYSGGDGKGYGAPAPAPAYAPRPRY